MPTSRTTIQLEDNSYRRNLGSSFAAPTVSGMIALLMNAFPTASAKQIYNILCASAQRPNHIPSFIFNKLEKSTNLTKDHMTQLLPEDIFGYGLVNVYSAYQVGQKNINISRPILDHRNNELIQRATYDVFGKKIYDIFQYSKNRDSQNLLQAILFYFPNPSHYHFPLYYLDSQTPRPYPSMVINSVKGLINLSQIPTDPKILELLILYMNLNPGDKEVFYYLTQYFEAIRTNFRLAFNFPLQKYTKLLYFLLRNYFQISNLKEHIESHELLHAAVEQNNLPVLRLFLEQGFSVSDDKIKQSTLINIASEFGFLDIVKFLYAYGITLDKENRKGYTPLHLASMNGFLDVVTFLVENGANVNGKSRIIKAPLIWASLYGYTDIVQYLIDQGANINTYSADDNTPLHLSIIYGRREITKILLKNKADVNIQGFYGATPLHFAVKHGDVNIVELLLSYGANQTIIDNEGLTPLDWAKSFEKKEILNVLLNYKDNSTQIRPLY